MVPKLRTRSECNELTQANAVGSRDTNTVIIRDRIPPATRPADHATGGNKQTNIEIWEEGKKAFQTGTRTYSFTHTTRRHSLLMEWTGLELLGG